MRGIILIVDSTTSRYREEHGDRVYETAAKENRGKIPRKGGAGQWGFGNLGKLRDLVFHEPSTALIASAAGLPLVLVSRWTLLPFSQ